MSSLLPVVTVATLAAHTGATGLTVSAAFSLNTECSMAAVSPAQLGISSVLRSLCYVAAAHSAVAAVDFSLVMLCDVVL